MIGRALISGIGGFVGSHLAELLVRERLEVHGIAHDDRPRPNLAAVADRVRLHVADLLDEAETARAIRAAAPDVVFHLAAQAIPHASWRDPRRTFEVNVLGTISVLEALRAAGGRTLLVLASTAEVYADAVEGDLPLGEDFPLGPRSPYAASKVAQETLVRQYARTGAIRAVVLRASNQIGPRLSSELVAGSFALQVARAEAGGERVVHVGNLDARRDFVDVRDVARAYLLVARAAEDKGRSEDPASPVRASPPGAERVARRRRDIEEDAVYNVATGQAVPIRAILERLVELARVPLEVADDPARRQPLDRPAIALDATRLRERTGWRPRVALADSLADTLEHFRAEVARRAPVGSDR